VSWWPSVVEHPRQHLRGLIDWMWFNVYLLSVKTRKS
jgi:hypothetical protein